MLSTTCALHYLFRISTFLSTISQIHWIKIQKFLTLSQSPLSKIGTILISWRFTLNPLLHHISDWIFLLGFYDFLRSIQTLASDLFCSVKGSEFNYSLRTSWRIGSWVSTKLFLLSARSDGKLIEMRLVEIQMRVSRRSISMTVRRFYNFENLWRIFLGHPEIFHCQ